MKFSLNNKSYTIDQLKSGQFIYHSSFEESTLKFCNEWLNGRVHFETQTSGSTGPPRKILFTRAQLEQSAKLTATALSLQKGFNALICLDTKYIAGQMMLVRSFISEMNVIALEPCANPFHRLSRDVKVDFAALVPYQIYEVLSSPDSQQFNSIQKIIIGGAAIHSDLITSLQMYSCSFYATYGMTETISHIALQKLNGKARQNYFHPLPTIRLQQDERECLVIYAPHVSEDKIITNDIVQLEPDHSFRILGRYDNVINTGGVKISPESVEEKIKLIFTNGHLANRFFLGGVPDEKLGMKLILVIEGETFTDSKLNFITGQFKAKLLKYEIPKEVKFIRIFIETETQKVNRKKTLQLITSLLSSQREDKEISI
jgi:O-succinylbenzoic acid--CoA ligase